MMLANAGRVMSMPMMTPMMVVTANPLTSPAPAFQSGIMAAIMVNADPKMILNARLIFCFQLRNSVSLRSASSVMMIWSSTPVPTAAMIPAMLARSRFQLMSAATPRVMSISLLTMIMMGNAILSFL